MTPGEFGNYIAGFAAAAYDQKYASTIISPISRIMAQTLVEDAGILYHASGATKAKNDPLDRTITLDHAW